jgi:hypothetical protein
MLPYQMIAGGKFTLTTDLISSGVNVECQSQNPPDFVVLKSITGWGEASDAQAIEWWWERSMGNGYANGILQSSEGSNPQLPAMTAYRLPRTGTTAVDAISVYDTANPPTFSALATTAITGTAGTFICTMADTGTIAVGDYVRLYNTTGELQIAGYTFQVTAVSANTSITLGYMASSGITFAADATAGSVLKFIPNRMYPRWKYIANITKASQAVVYFTAKNDFTVGEIVSFRVSSDFGMDEINNKQARVLAVTNSATVSSITLDLDTTGFTTFAFPTSATAAAGVSPAVCVPSASGVIPDSTGSATNPQQPPGTNLLDAFDNRNVRIIHFGKELFNVSSHTSDNGDVWCWQAYKFDSYNTNIVT